MSSSDIRPSVAWFAEQMEQRLRHEDNIKTAYETEDIRSLLEAVFDEWQELSQSILMHIRYGASAADVVKECADVATTAMMIACQMDEGMRTMRNGR